MILDNVKIQFICTIKNCEYNDLDLDEEKNSDIGL